MIRRLLPLLALALAACASSPPHYYTLVPPADARAAPADAPFEFELAPVGVPAQVDRPQLVLRTGASDLGVLDGERWIAPLPDELRSALSLDLVDALGAADASGQPASGRPRLRVRVDLRRFDSGPGAVVRLDAAWSVRMGAGGPLASCASAIDEPATSADPAALVAAHQRALARLATQIAAAARPLLAGRAPTCPSAPAGPAVRPG